MSREHVRSIVLLREPMTIGEAGARPIFDETHVVGYEISPYVKGEGCWESMRRAIACGKTNVNWSIYWRVGTPEVHLASHIADYPPTPEGYAEALAYIRSKLGENYVAP